MSQSKILIADDSPTVRNMLSSILQGAGYVTLTASNGIEAIEAAYLERPDTILLDIFMPKVNGYQVCRLLKDDVSVCDIPVIILTSAEGKTEKFWSLETGADEFMVKDFNTPKTILKTVKKFVARYSKIKSDVDIPGVSLSDPIEILSKLSALLDKHLYSSTLERLKVETILSSLAEGLVVVDEERTITSYNPIMAQMTTIPVKNALGKKCCDVFSGSLCKDACYFYDVFTSGKDAIDVEVEFKFAQRRRNGIMSALLSVSLLRDDERKLVGAVCVLKDITKIKEAEQIKADFISMATHELKTPLSIIKASAGNVLDGVVGEINKPQRECLEIIKNTSDRLLDLTSDLLDLSKFESGLYELTIEDVDVGSIIQRCLSDFEVLIKQKKIKVSSLLPKGLLKISADFNKVEQVMINLVSNAVKFTPEGGEIKIEVEEKKDFLECSVSDTGPGISDDAKADIFDKFKQIYDKQARQKGGTGLGLSVVKAIVQAHKGEVWVESEIGKGSKFVFKIPKRIVKK